MKQHTAARILVHSWKEAEMHTTGPEGPAGVGLHTVGPGLQALAWIGLSELAARWNA
jgi:hypothetical protein